MTFIGLIFGFGIDGFLLFVLLGIFYTFLIEKSFFCDTYELFFETMLGFF